MADDTDIDEVVDHGPHGRIDPVDPDLFWSNYGAQLHRIASWSEREGAVRLVVGSGLVALEGGEPVVLDAAREVREIRPLPRHDHRRITVAVGAPQLGEEDRPALRRRCLRMESLVTDDKGSRLQARVRQERASTQQEHPRESGRCPKRVARGIHHTLARHSPR